MKKEIVDLMQYDITIHNDKKYYDYTPVHIFEAEGSSTIQPRLTATCPTQAIKHIYEIIRNGVSVSPKEYEFHVFGTISVIRFYTEQRARSGKMYQIQALVDWE